MKAIDLITDALEEAGIKDYASSVDGDTINRSLKTLTKLVDYLSLDDVVIPYTQEIVQVVSGSPTIGVGGVVNVSRPREVLNTSYFLINGIKYPLELIEQESYNRLNLSASNGYPVYLYYERSMPLGKLYFWPNPQSIEMHLRVNSDLPVFADYSTDYEIEDGYKAMLTYNLAQWLCVGVKDVPKDIERLALITLRKLKNYNVTVGRLSFPSILTKRFYR